MSKKFFIVSDIHGFRTELVTSLAKAGFDMFNDNHIFVSCGDLLDRGEEPYGCLKLVNSLPNDRKILIRGNHEDLIQDAIRRGEFLSHDWSNGTVNTSWRIAMHNGIRSADADDLTILNAVEKDIEFQKYINSLVDYYEDDKNIFVHGWIPCKRNDQNKYHSRNVKYTFDEDWRNGDWDSARWINGMDAWNQGIRVDNKTIFCGHWHTSWARKFIDKTGVEWDNPYSTNPEHQKANFDVWKNDGIVALDACTALSHKVNVVVVEE